MKSICRFRFRPEIDREIIEAQLALAIVVAECMHGPARVRLGTGYLLSDDARRLVMDVSHEVGEYVAQLLIGLLIREIGEDEFSVERLQREPMATS